MTDDKINVSVHKSESQIKTREELIIKAEIAIIESKTRSIDEQIEQIINFISLALPEIPEREYKRGHLIEIKPGFGEAKKKFFENVSLLVPEQENYFIPEVRRLQKEMYRDRLINEKEKIENLLKLHTKWTFFHTHNPSMGR